MLAAGSVCNVFAAFSGNAMKRAMGRPGLEERLGSASNQFGVTNILALGFSLPLVHYLEGPALPRFVALLRSSPTFRYPLLASGVLLYVYNELSTLAMSITTAVTASVAKTAKRAFVIVGVALALGKELRAEEKLGAVITIGAVLLYSMVDQLGGRGAKAKAKAKKA